MCRKYSHTVAVHGRGNGRESRNQNVNLESGGVGEETEDANVLLRVSK